LEETVTERGHGTEGAHSKKEAKRRRRVIEGKTEQDKPVPGPRRRGVWGRQGDKSLDA